MQLRPDFTYIENLITTTLILAGEKIEKIKKKLCHKCGQTGAVCPDRLWNLHPRK